MIIVKHEAIINDINVIKYEYDHIGIKDFCYVEPSETGNYIAIVHGHGSRADQLYTREDVFTSWYPVIKKYNLGIISFDTQGNGWMNRYVVWAMEKMIKYLKKAYNIKNTVFAGGSMGGTSVLIYALYHPEDIDGLIANCPASNMTDYYHSIEHTDHPVLKEIRDTIKERYEGTPEESSMYKESNANEHPEIFTMPTIIAHGNSDELIPFEYTEKLINTLKGKENFSYKIIENGNHDSPIALFPDELNWICKKLNIEKIYD